MTGNKGFAEDLTKWIFQETGVMKVIGSTHWSETGGEVGKTEYRKNEQIVSCFILGMFFWVYDYERALDTWTDRPMLNGKQHLARISTSSRLPFLISFHSSLLDNPSISKAKADKFRPTQSLYRNTIPSHQHTPDSHLHPQMFNWNSQC